MNRLYTLMSLLFLTSLAYAQALYLSHVKNDTPDTLYKVIVPQEDYEVLVPPGSGADFGSWLDLRRDKEVQLAVLAGAGEPIFVHGGPESAGCTIEDSFAQSVVYWFGIPNASDEDKIYKTCCLTNEDGVSLELTIQPDGTPLLEEVNQPESEAQEQQTNITDPV